MLDKMVIDRLLLKHSGRAVPALVSADDPELGLIDPELLKSYNTGLQAREHLPIACLLCAVRPVGTTGRWTSASLAFPEIATESRGKFCKVLRKASAEDARCMQCDRDGASRAAERGRAVAYICPSGLLDLAAPVVVDGTAIAAVLAGQLRPRKGSKWDAALLETGAVLEEGEASRKDVEIEDFCTHRAEQAARRASLSEADWRRYYQACRTVSQDGLEEILAFLGSVAKQIAAIAEGRLAYERAELQVWLREQVSKPLEKLGFQQPELPEAWDLLGAALDAAGRRFDLDYLALIDLFSHGDHDVEVLASSGLNLNRGDASMTTAKNTQGVTALRTWARNGDDTQQLKTRELRGIEPLEAIHRSQKKATGPLAIRLASRTSGGPLVLLAGRFDHNIRMEDFAAYRSDIQVLLSDVKTVCDVIRLTEQQAAFTRRQAQFVEDVAHDIRSPIQTLLAIIGELSLTQSLGLRTRELIGRIGAIIRRLNLMSERVWVLERVDRGHPDLQQTQRVSVLQLMQECRRSLLEVAAARGIDIVLTKDLEGLPLVHVNRDLFFYAVLNILDNAVKYSKEGSSVRVHAQRLSDRVEIRVANLGIPVHEKDYEAIFNRFYRAQNAEAYTSDGTGIGLAVAQAFAEKHGRIFVVSQPVEGMEHFVTTFYIHLTRTGW